MGKPFEAVERLPVPDHIRDVFKQLQSAEVGRGRSSNAGSLARSKAAEKVAQRTAEAAGHFGGDVGKMTTHYKRWTRWRGAAMGLADIPMDEEAVGTAMQRVSKAMRSKPVRRALKGTES